MEYSRMVVDTSIFIEYLRTKEKEKTALFNISDDTTLVLSTVTIYELYAGAKTELKWNDVKLLTEDLPILPFTIDVAQQAAKIFHDLTRKNQIIEFRDIFIAATALVNGLPIKTLNKKHFQRIEGLEVI